MPQSGHITRVEDEGVTYRWELTRSGWPGRRTAITLEGMEVVLVDRFERDHNQRFTCHPRAFIEGCFHDAILEQFNARVLDEVIAAVKARGIGLDELKALAPVGIWSVHARPSAYPEPSAVIKAPPLTPPPTLFAKPPPPRPSPAKPLPRFLTTPTQHSASASTIEQAARVDVMITAVEQVGLTLFLALKGLSGLSSPILRERLQSLPALIVSDTERANAETIRERLSKLGATVGFSLPGAGAPVVAAVSTPAAAPKHQTVKIRRKKAPAALYQVTVTAVTGKKSQLVKALAASVTGTRKKATTLLRRLPSRVAIGLSHEDAVQLKGKLEALGAAADISTVE